MSVTMEVGEPDADGVAPGLPADAAELGLRPASPARRAAAFAIDAAVVAFLALPALIVTFPLWGVLPQPGGVYSFFERIGFIGRILLLVGVILIAAFIVIQVVAHGLVGLTVGKQAVGIRSVNVSRFGRPGLGRIVLRDLVFVAAGCIVPVIGVVPFLVSSLWGARGRSWLDVIGGTWCVDVHTGAEPSDRNARPRSPAATSLPPLPTSSIVPLRPAEPVTHPFPEPLALASPAAASFVADTIPSAPVSGPPVPAVVPPLEARATLVFDDDARFPVAGDGLIGRNPQPAPGEAAAELVAVSDSSWSISKTHAAFGMDSEGFWVADRASRNGTSVRAPSGERMSAAGRRVYVRAGDAVVLGQREFVVEWA